jgi:hypothetical protein
VRIDKGDAHATRFVIPTADVADAPLLLFTGKEAAMAWLRSSRKNGWCQGPLPLISIESCVGAAFRGKHLFEWLPGDQIAAPDEPVLTDESITARMVEDCIHEVRGVTVWPTCYLDIDWQFEEIEREARKLRGHNYFGERHSSLREVVWKSLGDFDAVMTSKYPIAPPSALAYFWQSWQIHQHVRQFCKAELVNSVADGTLPFMGQDCNEAGWFALRKLSSYASAISMVGDQASGEPAAEVTDEAIETISNAESQSRKRGPKPDYDAAARVAEIVMRVAPERKQRNSLLIYRPLGSNRPSR